MFQSEQYEEILCRMFVYYQFIVYVVFIFFVDKFGLSLLSLFKIDLNYILEIFRRLEIIMLREVKQIKNDKYDMFFFMDGVQILKFMSDMEVKEGLMCGRGLGRL